MINSMQLFTLLIVDDKLEVCKMWFKVIKREKPKWEEFFKYDIQKYLDMMTLDIYGYKGEKMEDVIKRRKEIFKEKDFPDYKAAGYYSLSRALNIPESSAKFIFKSYKGPNPIKDIESYNKAIRADLEARQKAKQIARTSGRYKGKKGQRKQNRQTSQKKTRSQRQAASQRKQNKQARQDRERREDEQRRFRNERRGL